MPHLNVEISEEAMIAARIGAAKAGVRIKAYVERVLLDARVPAQQPTKQEPVYDYSEHQ